MDAQQGPVSNAPNYDHLFAVFFPQLSDRRRTRMSAQQVSATYLQLLPLELRRKVACIYGQSQLDPAIDDALWSHGTWQETALITRARSYLAVHKWLSDMTRLF